MSSNLPPGVTDAMIEAQFGDRPCDICGLDPAECACPECPECNSYGDPRCYAQHGLKLTAEQVIAHNEMQLRELEAQLVEQSRLVLDLKMAAAVGELDPADWKHIVRRPQ